MIKIKFNDMLKLENKNGFYIDEDNEITYYENDNLHRLDGPTIIYPDGILCWHLFNIEYTEEEYNKAISNLPLLYWENRNNLLPKTNKFFNELL